MTKTKYDITNDVQYYNFVMEVFDCMRNFPGNWYRDNFDWYSDARDETIKRLKLAERKLCGVD